MTNIPPRKRAFQVRPATSSFLDLPPAGTARPTYLDRHFERIVSILSKRTLADRSRPR